MGDWKPKYRWTRTWGDERGQDGKRHQDWKMLDGDLYAGRIRLETSGPTKGLWQWAGSYPRPLYGAPLTPNAGYKPSAAEAGQMVEDYWDRMKAVVAERLASSGSIP